jgi:hypothetical protein
MSRKDWDEIQKFIAPETPQTFGDSFGEPAPTHINGNLCKKQGF